MIMLNRIVRVMVMPPPRRLRLLALFTALYIMCAYIAHGAELAEKTSPTAQPGVTPPADRTRRVLLLFGEDQGFPMSSALGQSIRSALINQSASRIEFYAEYLDRSRIN